MSYEIIPYIGIDKVAFGFTPEGVSSFWGAPERTRPTKLSQLEEIRSNLYCRYSRHLDVWALVEVSFTPGVIVSCMNIDIFRDKRAFSKLLAMDNSPYEVYGTIVFLKLGIAVSGLHDENESQLALTAFAKGHWDQYKNRFRRYPEGSGRVAGSEHGCEGMRGPDEQAVT